MISETKFYGGAEYLNIAGTANLHLASKKFQTVHNVSGAVRTLMLPDVLTQVRKNQVGHWFYILLDSTSTSNLDVKYLKNGVTTALVTLTPGKVAHIWLADVGVNAKWYQTNRTLNTARTLTHSTIGTIANPDAEETFDPFCFDGSDCDFADANPLNGKDGRPTVLAPMFQDVPAFAKNQTREAIRAADVVMPDKVVLRLASGCFTRDPLHPKGATILSDEFYAALYNDGNPHLLAYQGAINGTSRNPYHIAWGATGPDWFWNAALGVKRFYYNKVINYTLNSTGVTYQIEIRFVFEHTVNPLPTFNRCGGGGKNNSTDGLWGSLFMIQIFATEIYPTWVDGSAHQATGSLDPTLTFTRNDPFVLGAMNSIDDVSDKFCHPQLAAIALLPTTFHSPYGRKWVPLQDRATYYLVDDDPNGPGTGIALNREKAYNVDNGAPWTTVFPTGSTTADSVFGNIVFGKSIGSINGRGMTLGGDLPRSMPVEWLCWENGAGVGRTYLKPSKPGWDEAEGVLDLSNGNCGVFTLPVDCNDTDSENPSDSNNWHLDPHPCIGHPDEPFEGYGGSHKCFRNFDGGVANSGSGDFTKCCTSLIWQLANCYEMCTRTTDVFDENCDPVSSKCDPAGWFFTQRVMYLKDYNYYAGGNQLLREAEWSRILPDPDQVMFDYSYAPTDVANLVDEVGTWTKVATVTNASVAGANPIRAAMLYEPAGWTNNRDCIVSATVKKVRHKSHTLLVKSAKVSGVIRGYGINTVPVTPGAGTTDITIQLCKYSGGVKTVLASGTIPSVTVSDCDLVLDVVGTDLTATITPSGGSAHVLEASDVEFDSGWPGLGTESTATGNIEFANFAVLDTSVDFLTIDGSIGPNYVSITWPQELMLGYGQCEGHGNDNCGVSPNCSCTSWSDSMTRVNTSDGPGTGADFVTVSVSPDGVCTTGDNPTWAFGPLPECCEYKQCAGWYYSCGLCPAPFPALTMSFPNRCSVKKGDLGGSCNGGYQHPEPKMCGGSTYWKWTNVACF